MRYQHPQLRTNLAAEYVLGTLRGAARARFEKLLKTDAALQGEVVFWQERLADLALRLPPQAPREVVWTALERELARDAEMGRKVVPLRGRPAAPNTKVSPAVPLLVKGWALAASVAAIALGAGFLQTREQNNLLAANLAQTQAAVDRAQQLAEQASAEVQAANQKLAALQPQAMPYVAVFAPADGGTDMRWAVSLHPSKNLMRVVLTGSKPMPMSPGAKALELWMIAKDGPHALGVLPLSGAGTPHEMPLPDMPPDELGASLTLAVSEEPEGGSPTGKPTGKVLGAFAAPRAI